MTWVRLDDQFPDHPKVLEAGPAAAWLYICGLSYASRYLTDGFIPAVQVRRLADMDGAEEAAERLVTVGLWAPADDGYQIHDYLDYQQSATKVREEREAAKQRMQRLRSPEVRPNISRSSPEVRQPPPIPRTSGEDVATAVATTAVAARPRPHVELTEHSEGARVVLEEWRRAHGKRSPPKLNPTQAERLEQAVVDLGVDRLAEAARYTAEKGLGEFHKCVTSAYSKRQIDEGRGPPRNGHTPVGRRPGDSRNPADYFGQAARR